MKQVAGSEPVIAIEWNGHPHGQQSTLDARHVSKDELLNPARGAAAGTPERLSSGAKSAKMKAKAQV